MSGGLEVRLPWGDGEYSFRLTIGGWRRVQEKCDAGPEEIVARLSPTVQALTATVKDGEGGTRQATLMEALATGFIGRWRVDDVREVIYQALLGGGADLPTVTVLMADLVDSRPPRENVMLAYAIAMAGLSGVPDDKVGETEGETATKTLSPESASGSASSTAEVGARGSRRRKSTK